MALVIKGYTCDDHSPVIMGFGEPCDEQGNICAKTVIHLENVITASYKYVPLTGSYSVEPLYSNSDKNLEGWRWNMRQLENKNYPQTVYQHTIGGHSHGLKEGTKFSWWQSGTIANTQLLYLKNLKFTDEVTTWTPVVHSGVYTVLWEVKNLYSDFSCIEKAECSQMENGVNYFDIREDAKIDSVSCVLYKRDDQFINWPHITYNYVDYFTGRLPENSDRLQTVDCDANILWENLDERSFEYIIENISATTTEPVTCTDETVNVKEELFSFLADYLNLEGTGHLNENTSLSEDLGLSPDEQNELLFLVLEHFSLQFGFVFGSGLPAFSSLLGDWISFIEAQVSAPESRTTYPSSTPRTWRLIFNRDVCMQVGDWNKDVLPTASLAPCLFEDKGFGNGSSRDAFTNYFPIVENSVRVFVVEDTTGDGEYDFLEEWTEVESLKFSTPTDKHYSVDSDLGIITLGGYKAPDLILRHPIDVDDVELKVFPSGFDIASYPDQGVIKIGDEEILYYTKGHDRFYDLVRGYNNTTPSVHSIGDFVEDRQHGEAIPVSSKIFLSYEATPRIEYEVTSIRERTSNRNPFIDLKAIRNVVSNNILQISPVETHVAKLKLETSAKWLTSDIYGPVLYGTDFTRLTARAEDSVGNPVEGIKITISIADKSFGKRATGGLNGSLQSYTSISNSLGEIYALYNAPYDWEKIRKLVKSTTHSGPNTILSVEELPPNVGSEDVTIFQVLKSDHTLGTVGTEVDILRLDHPLDVDPGDLNFDTTGNGTPDSYIQISNTTEVGSPGTVYNLANITLDAHWDDVVSMWESEQDLNRETPDHYHTLFPNSVIGCSKTGYGNAVIKIKFEKPGTDEYTWRSVRIDNAVPYYGRKQIQLDPPAGSWEIDRWSRYFENTSNACALQDLTVWLTSSGKLLYNSSSEIAGFQFEVAGAEVVSCSGGDAGANGFTLSTNGSTVIAFNMGGGSIPAGCGVLTELELIEDTGTETVLSDFVFVDPLGVDINIEYADVCKQSNEAGDYPSDHNAGLSSAVPNTPDAGDYSASELSRRREILGTTFILAGQFSNSFIPGSGSYDGWVPVKALLIGRNSELWNAQFLEGINVLLYEWSTDFRHPITNQPGAYAPVQCSSASGTKITFNNKHLPIPEPFNSLSNLGGYIAVTPDIVTLQASCRDPISGRIILSNTLRLRLDLPLYLKGVAPGELDQYGNRIGIPIPYGFGFQSIEGGDPVGTGIGGANFLTINPFNGFGIDALGKGISGVNIQTR